MILALVTPDVAEALTKVSARAADLGWAAGFFDGEGSVTHERRPTGIYIRLSVTQCGSDRELKEFARIVGRGRVNGPYAPSRDKDWRDPVTDLPFYQLKERYHLNINGNTASREVIELLRPYLRGVKAQTFDRLAGGQ